MACEHRVCEGGCSGCGPCGGSCMDDCYGCTGGCGGACSDNCTGDCEGGCDDTCDGTCSNYCNYACKNTAVATNYNNLVSTLSGVIKISDALNLSEVVREEINVRHKSSLTPSTPKLTTSSGKVYVNGTEKDIVIKSIAQGMYDDLVKLGKSPTSLSGKDVIIASIVNNYISLAKALYTPRVPLY